ncbi:MAG: HD domain-containing phosphohydrolase, partial [Phycisphaerae bacterium]
ETKLGAIIRNANVTPEDKAEVVQRVGKCVAMDLIDSSVDPAHVDRTASVVDCMIEGILSDPLIAASLLEMAGHERSTASHMFVVATLAVMLGAEVFGPDKETLEELGFAGMLHDVGKLSIGAEVLNKTEPLTRAELELVHQHPIESVRLIGENPQVSAIARQVILQHHERIDGHGYPLGLDGSILLPQSKLLSIVDSFHAMIGHRSYRMPLTPSEANRVLATQAGRQFDAEMMACWTDLFKRSWTTRAAERVRKSIIPRDEISARYEHRPVPTAPRNVVHRPPRYGCYGHASVQCVYAGRLVDATAAPDEFGALTHDVSRGGLCIYAAHPMYRGEVVRVKIDMNGKGVWVDSVVAWCRRQEACVYRIGLRFTARIAESQCREPSPVRSIAELRNARAPTHARTSDPTEQVDSDKPNPQVTAPVHEPADNALEALVEIESMRKVGPDAQNTTITLAMSGDSRVRLKAVDVLAGIDTKAARRTIVSLLDDKTPDVRERAAIIAGTLQIQEAVGPLRKLLDDPVVRVALRAAGALGRLDDRSGLQLVARVLSGDCPETRLAAHTLGEITRHRFAANQQGIESARRYLNAKKAALVG